ncbi:probable phytol kinase 1, chloroplastic isoform X3 [Gastrolobium bilobum]|uniref:probable phytol kinase 1, chloroplastic isoform X3 n=1 Tax=Gastrolobium bilobum TaxID=150636 RepID=UPI002AB1B27B|nr:probable phytol kinase 1, chloroplastic isoform X3 [Gastrolobium bilobum]
MALLSSLLLPISAVRRHPSPISTTLPPWKLGLNPTTNYAVRFLCSPLVPPVLLGQRVSRFVIPATATATAEYLLHDAGATVAVLGGGYALVFAFDDLTRRNFLNQDLSRKLVHILSGLLFLVSWPIFSRGQHEGNWVPLPGERAGSGRAAPAVWAPSNTTKARYFAAFVPLMNCLRLLVNGLSLASDEGLIKSVTRKGDPRELLKGPLYYVVILMLCALVFWRESPIGVVALAMMSGGDGVADIIGRRYGSMKIPYNQKKSWAGCFTTIQI